jgi:hypothetical protein
LSPLGIVLPWAAAAAAAAAAAFLEAGEEPAGKQQRGTAADTHSNEVCVSPDDAVAVQFPQRVHVPAVAGLELQTLLQLRVSSASGGSNTMQVMVATTASDSMQTRRRKLQAPSLLL